VARARPLARPHASCPPGRSAAALSVLARARAQRRAAAAAPLAAGRVRPRPARQDLPGAGHARAGRVAGRRRAAALCRVPAHARAAAARDLPAGMRRRPAAARARCSCSLPLRMPCCLQPVGGRPARARRPFARGGQPRTHPVASAPRPQLPCYHSCHARTAPVSLAPAARMHRLCWRGWTPVNQWHQLNLNNWLLHGPPWRMRARALTLQRSWPRLTCCAAQSAGDALTQRLPPWRCSPSLACAPAPVSLMDRVCGADG